jgi:transposase-like protein
MQRVQRVGRPGRCTEHVTARLCELIGAGAATYQACAAVGISPSTVRHWRAQARPDHRRHHERYVCFVEALTRAEEERIATLIRAIHAAALPHEVVKVVVKQRWHPVVGLVTLREVTTTVEWDWRAALCLLQYWDPEHWGRR